MKEKNFLGLEGLKYFWTKIEAKTIKIIEDKIAQIIANAPEDLDTLKEIADWISTHEDSASAMNTAILANTEAISGKADKSHTHTKSQITDFPTSLKNPNALTVNGKTYDGSSAVNAGVQTVANGGTGATTATQAINNLAAGIDEDTADGSDTMGFITTDSTSIDLNADDKKIYKRSGLRVWNWIKGKVKAVLGLDETSLTTKTITSTGTITASTSMTSAEFHANSYFPKDNVDSFLSFIQQTDGNSFIRINTPHKVSIEPGEGLNVSGNCTMAKNLTVNGSIITTEFKGDVKGNADTATAVLDCGDTARTIKIGYAGMNLASCRYLAAYNEDGSQIRTIPISAVSVGNADTVDSHHFNWTGKGGQPTWVWGGDDSANQYVYNPSNFNVNYANSAGSVAWSNVSGKPAYITVSYSNGILNLYTN